MLSLMDTMVSLVVKVLWKLISLICFRVYLEVNVHKNPTCFSRWSVRGELKGKIILEEHGAKKYDRESVAKMIINKIKNEDMDLEEVLSDDYVADCIRDSIEDLLFDILP